MPDEIIDRLVQEYREMVVERGKDNFEDAQAELTRKMKSWGLPWTAEADEYPIPGTAVTLTSAESGSLLASWLCPTCHESVRRVVRDASDIGLVVAMSRDEANQPYSHKHYEDAKAAAFAELIDPRGAMNLITYCREIREEVTRQTPTATNGASADYLLKLKLKSVEIEAILRAGFARGGDRE